MLTYLFCSYFAGLVFLTLPHERSDWPKLLLMFVLSPIVIPFVIIMVITKHEQQNGSR
jgi:hypothetical protein